MIDAKIINPFLESAISTTSMAAQLTLTVGKPFLKTDMSFTDDQVLIVIGVTGAMKGQVIINIPSEHAKQLASGMMMGMPVEELDEMSLSAISELGNMIMGNAATLFSTRGIVIDITPPMLQRGTIKMGQFSAPIMSVPLSLNGTNYMDMDIIIKEN